MDLYCAEFKLGSVTDENWTSQECSFIRVPKKFQDLEMAKIFQKSNKISSICRKHLKTVIVDSNFYPQMFLIEFDILRKWEKC